MSKALYFRQGSRQARQLLAAQVAVGVEVAVLARNACRDGALGGAYVHGDHAIDVGVINGAGIVVDDIGKGYF